MELSLLLDRKSWSRWGFTWTKRPDSVEIQSRGRLRPQIKCRKLLRWTCSRNIRLRGAFSSAFRVPLCPRGSDGGSAKNLQAWQSTREISKVLNTWRVLPRKLNPLRVGPSSLGLTRKAALAFRWPSLLRNGPHPRISEGLPTRMPWKISRTPSASNYPRPDVIWISPPCWTFT